MSHPPTDRSSDPDRGDGARTPRDEERVTFSRVTVWSVIALLVLLGVVLFFVFHRQLAPVLG
jgi:type VI protein secretion system component VasF